MADMLATEFGSIEALAAGDQSRLRAVGNFALDVASAIQVWLDIKSMRLKIVQKLLDHEIVKSKHATLARIMYGLGIRHVGRAMADVLAQEFGSLDALAAADCERLRAISDVGPEVTSSILAWFASPENRHLLKKLRQHGIDPKAARAVADGRLTGKIIVITGELAGMAREEAEDLVRKEGGKAAAAVSKNTDYLVVGESPGGTKVRAAEKYSIRVIDQAEFLRILGR
jgi:DNA ligase (NAD+)